MTMAVAQLLKANGNRSPAPHCRVRLTDFVDGEPQSDFLPLSLHDAADVPALPTEPSNADSVKETLVALDSAAAQWIGQRDTWLEQVQQEAVELGIAIAERLLRGTLDKRPEAILDLVRNVLQWPATKSPLRVRLHPEDFDVVEQHLPALRDQLDANVTFVRDAALSRGDCVAETPNGLVDGRLEVILDRIAAELLS